MTTMSDTITAVATAMTGLGWALYFAAGAAVVAATLAYEHLTKGRNRG
jgi:hypothetical protein